MDLSIVLKIKNTITTTIGLISLQKSINTENNINITINQKSMISIKSHKYHYIPIGLVESHYATVGIFFFLVMDIEYMVCYELDI